MYSQIRCILFASLVSLTACTSSGDPPAAPAPTPTPPVVEEKLVIAPPSMEKALEKPAVTPVVAKVEKKVEEKTKLEKPTIEHPIPATYAACMDQGKAAEAKGDRDYARELFEAAARLDGKKSLPHVELARSYIATGDKTKAIASARKAIKLAPSSSQAHNTLGRAELLRFNYEAAIEAFTESTRLDGKNVWAFNNLGLTYLTMKKYEEAILALEVATNLPGAEGYMFNNLGTAYEQLDQLDHARNAYDKGGKLGSAAAKHSKKRLQGVDSLANVNKADRRVERELPAKKELVDEHAAKKGNLDVTPDKDAAVIKKDVEKKPDEKKSDEKKSDEKPAPSTI